jgi:hypothetical protein
MTAIIDAEEEARGGASKARRGADRQQDRRRRQQLFVEESRRGGDADRSERQRSDEHGVIERITEQVHEGAEREGTEWEPQVERLGEAELLRQLFQADPFCTAQRQQHGEADRGGHVNDGQERLGGTVYRSR